MGESVIVLLKESFHGNLNVFLLHYFGSVKNLDLQGLPFCREAHHTFSNISRIYRSSFSESDGEHISIRRVCDLIVPFLENTVLRKVCTRYNSGNYPSS